LSPSVPPAVYCVALAVLGLLAGSFLNVVIYRLPQGLSMVGPGSSCPVCRHPVRPYDNVPVLSWMLLRGRCRDCRTVIPLRYLLVEVVTATLFVVAGWRFGLSPYTGAVLVLMAGGVALFTIDIEHHRLPFAITAATGLVSGAALVVDGLIHGFDPAPTAMLSLLVWLTVYGTIWLATAGRGMGLGDVALAPVLGMVVGWLGWGASLVGLMSGFVLGAVVGVVLLATGRASGGTRIPHGPFLLSGASVGMFAGESLWEWYLAVFGLG
jgi:leader peptidase (prepilin peptidase)/N-methyltransferase